MDAYTDGLNAKDAQLHVQAFGSKEMYLPSSCAGAGCCVWLDQIVNITIYGTNFLYLVYNVTPCFQK